MPSTSAGTRSGVNWMRWNSQLSDAANAFVNVVLPVPGTSSISTWPRHSRAITARSIDADLPTMTRCTFSRTRFARSRTFAIDWLAAVSSDVSGSIPNTCQLRLIFR